MSDDSEECLLSKLKDLSSVSRTHWEVGGEREEEKPGIVVYTYNSHSGRKKQVDLCGLLASQSRLFSKVWAIERPCLKLNKQDKKPRADGTRGTTYDIDL